MDQNRENLKESPDQIFIVVIIQVDSYQETVERWKRRAGALSKQCTDLSTVMRKYITGTNSRGQYLFLCHSHNEQTCSNMQIHHGYHEARAINTHSSAIINIGFTLSAGIQFLFPQIRRQKGETRLLQFASHVLLVSRFVFTPKDFIRMTFTFPIPVPFSSWNPLLTESQPR